MKYELEELENSLKLEDFSDWEATVTRLPKAIMAGALSLEQAKLAMYIRWHQEGLADMANTLYEAKREAELARVADLLDFLDRSFSQETNSFVEIPLYAWERFKTALPEQVETIAKALRKLKIGAEFREAALIPLASWTDERNQRRPTYQQYRYVMDYMAQLTEQLISHKIDEEALIFAFVKLNFNHLRAFHLGIKHIEDQLKGGGINKEFVLKKLKRKIELIHTAPGMVYNDHASELRDQLGRWIEEELLLLQDEPAAVACRRIKINQPVAVIAYLNKLLYKHHFYAEENQSEIIRHMVDSYSSMDTEEISMNSYASKYRMKAPADATARALRKLLKPILEEVDQLLR